MLKVIYIYMIPLARYLTLPVLVLAILPQTQSAMYPCWISGCKSLQPKAWFPQAKQLWPPGWWFQLFLFSTLPGMMVPIHGLLFIIYNIYVLWDGLKPPATEWHGMTWRWNAEYQNNSWHWTPRFRPLKSHIALVVYLPASRHAGRRCSTLDEIFA